MEGHISLWRSLHGSGRESRLPLGVRVCVSGDLIIIMGEICLVRIEFEYLDGGLR